MKKSTLRTALAAALGVTAIVTAPMASAAVNTFSYNGFFTMLDSGGGAVANTSKTAKDVTRFQTAITGTLSFDSITGAGTGTLTPFEFNSNPVGLDATARGIKMQAVGDGMGGAGTLVVGNMLFDWNTNVGIPVSIVLDAGGFFASGGAPGAVAAAPASDGTFVGAGVDNTDASGYLALGPLPISTTEWNTTNINGCLPGNCMGNGSSGGLPLVTDTAVNGNEFLQGDGVGVGGSPFQDGPFKDFNPNFDITTLTFLSSEDATIEAMCTFEAGNDCPTVPNAVPVPAAVWLFGSGLLGLVGIARRKKA